MPWLLFVYGLDFPATGVPVAIVIRNSSLSETLANISTAK